MGHYVVDLIGLLGAFAGPDRPLELAVGIGRVDQLEQHHRVAARLLLGCGAQARTLGDPGVPDLAAAAMVDQHAERVLPHPVGEGHRQRLLAAADVGEVPAVTDLRSADRPGPRGVGHVAGVYPGRGLCRGGAQVR